jgi:hypothetical protein
MQRSASSALRLAALSCAAAACSAANAITVLNATYGANCNAQLAGDLTPQVRAFCDGADASCAYTICLCNWTQCGPGTPPCVDDPAPGCAKDFAASWRCASDSPGTARSLALPAESSGRVAALTCGPAPAPPTPRDVTVAAFVYDPWSSAPEVFGSHGPNWTEWELVRRAEPRFPGHQQPHVPLWGEIDTSLPDTWDLLNGAALAAGIEVYMWDWYWWSDAPRNPILVNGLENGFLRASSSRKMKFALMWANQDWEDLMPAKRLEPPLVMFHGATNATVFALLSDYWITTYFGLENYWRVPVSAAETECPLVSIYEIDVLVAALGGLDPAAAALAAFRARAAAAGFPCVHIQVMGFGARSLPAPTGLTLQRLGVNSVTDYCPQHYQGMDSFPLVDYAAYSQSYVARYGDLASQVSPLSYWPNFGAAWDPSPRTVQSDHFDNWGYPATPVLQPTVEEFASAASASGEAVAASCEGLPSWQPCVLTVYAYTEFSEGGSLWPTVLDGFGRLNAFTAVFGNRTA